MPPYQPSIQSAAPLAPTFNGLLASGQYDWLVLFGAGTTQVSSLRYLLADILSHYPLLLGAITSIRYSHCNNSSHFNLLVTKQHSSALIQAFKIARPSRSFHLRPHLNNNIATIASTATTSATTTSASIGSIKNFKIASLNINGLQDKKLQLIDFVIDQRVDILCLQEHRRVLPKNYTVALPGFTASVVSDVPNTPGQRGVAILVRNGIRHDVIVTHPSFIIIRLLINSTRIYVCCVYLPCGGASSQSPVLTSLASSLAPLENFTILGDWNTRSSHELANKLANHTSHSFSVLKNHSANTTNYTYIKGNQRSQLDFVVVSDNIAHQLGDMSIHNDYNLSDHLPISTNLRHVDISNNISHTNNSNSTPTTMFNCNAIKPSHAPAILNHAAFAALRDSVIVDYPTASPSSENNDELANQFVNVALGVLAQVVPKNNGLAAKHKCFLPSNIKRIMIKKRVVAHRLRQAISDGLPTSELAAQLTQLENSIKAMIKCYRSISYQKFITNGIDSLNNNPRRFYSFCRQLGASAKNIKSSGPSPIICNGTLLDKAADQLHAWSSFHTQLSQDQTGHSKISHLNINYWINKLNLDTVSNNFNLTDLNKDPSWAEIRSSLSLLSVGKARGPSDIPTELLKLCARDSECETPLSQLLFHLIKLSFSTGSIPTPLNNAYVVNVHKRGTDPCIMDNYRPISCIDHIAKLICSILNSRLKQFADTNNIVSSNQVGFKASQEIFSNIIPLHEICSRRLSAGFPTFVGFLDVKSAFPSVPHALLIASLKAVGINGLFLNMISSLYSSSCFRVRLGSHTSDNIPLARGLRQGCPLSPLLFNIFFDSIIKCVPSTLHVSLPGITNSRINSLLFADDIVVLTRSASALAESINHMSSWLEARNMCLNARKCGVMGIGSASHAHLSTSNMPILVNNSPIPIVDTYKYLGLSFSFDLSLIPMLNDRISISRNCYSSMIPFLSSRLIPLFCKIMCIKSFLLPRLTFGGELFGMIKSPLVNSIKQLNTLFLNALRLASQGSTAPLCSPSCLYIEFNTYPIDHYLSAARARFYLKYRSSSSAVAVVGSNPTPINNASSPTNNTTLIHKIINAPNFSFTSSAKSWVVRTTKNITRVFASTTISTSNVAVTSSSLTLPTTPTTPPQSRVSYLIALFQNYLSYSSVAQSTLLASYSFNLYKNSNSFISSRLSSFSVICGVSLISRIRVGSFWFAPRVFNSRSHINSFRFGDQSWLTSCPFCHATNTLDSLDHMFLSCSAWSQERSMFLSQLSALNVASAAPLVGSCVSTGNGEVETVIPDWRKAGNSANGNSISFVSVAKFLNSIIRARNVLFWSKVDL